MFHIRDFTERPTRVGYLALIYIIALFALGSCATGIKPPDPDARALLVLPVSEINEAQIKTHGFYYVYEIVNVDNTDIKHRAIFKFPLKEGMLIVDSLPPGNYAVTTFAFYPMGTGDFTYGENVTARDDRFSLEAGKITIFSLSLDVRLFNEIPGRGMETTYEFDMKPLTQRRRETIIGKLGTLQYLTDWEVAVVGYSVIAPPKNVEEPTYTSPIRGEELRMLISGNTFSGENEISSGFDIYNAIDGTIYGRLDSGSRDTGTWKLFLDDRYCRRLTKWRNGEWDCFQISTLEDNKFRMKAIGKPYEGIFTIRAGDPEGLTGESATKNQLAGGFDYTGIYTSEITGDNKARLIGSSVHISLTQNGKTISGTIGDSQGKIWGDVVGNAIKFDWYTDGGHTGSGKWKVGTDSSELQGIWTSSSGNEGGVWNLKKTE